MGQPTASSEQSREGRAGRQAGGRAGRASGRGGGEARVAPRRPRRAPERRTRGSAGRPRLAFRGRSAPRPRCRLFPPLGSGLQEIPAPWKKPGLLPSTARRSESQHSPRKKKKPPSPPPPPPPRSPQLWASRAEGGGRREDGRRWPRKGWAAGACETPRAPSGSGSGGSEQTRHKGGSHRSCQSEALPVTGVAPPPPPPPPPPPSPRPLSVSGLWCSAGGDGGGGGVGETHCACALAAPPGHAPRSQAGPGAASGRPGGPGAGWGRRGADSLVSPPPFSSSHPRPLPHVDGVAICAICVCVCVREERGHATLGSGRKAWRTSRRRCLLREPRPPGRVAFPSPRGANKSLGLRGEDRDAAPCAR